MTQEQPSETDIERLKVRLRKVERNMHYAMAAAAIFGLATASGVTLLTSAFSRLTELSEKIEEFQVEQIVPLVDKVEELQDIIADAEKAALEAIHAAKEKSSATLEEAAKAALDAIDAANSKSSATLSETVEQAISAAASDEWTELISSVAELEANVAPRATPPGAIVAFDLRTGCPDEWTDIGETEPEIFAGRVLVAVGKYKNRETRQYRGRGGDETHTLSLEEMPAHRHDIQYKESRFSRSAAQDKAIDGLSGRKTAHTLAVGGGGAPVESASAHNNMPPYIALYFCKRD